MTAPTLLVEPAAYALVGHITGSAPLILSAVQARNVPHAVAGV